MRAKKSFTLLSTLVVTFILVGNLSSPIAFAKPLTSCGAAKYSTRLLQNVVCPNGAPNSQATRLLKTASPSMMALKRSASMHLIYKAICNDWKHSTGPDLMVTYDYLVALNDWTAKRYQDVYSNYPDCDLY
jgi:hypothetical protein